MRRRSLSGRAGAIVVAIGAMVSTAGAAGGAVGAAGQVTAEAAARLGAAMKIAFAPLYALPQDTDAAAMGEWVRDTDRTTADVETGTWTIRITRLADTGQALRLDEEMSKLGGSTSARQIEETTRAMQRLEGKISKAEAEASLEVVVTLNAPEVAVGGLSPQARRTTPAIAGASLALRSAGDWMRVEDAELDHEYERWSPETLVIAFGPSGPAESQSRERDATATIAVRSRVTGASNGISTIFVRAQGSGEMIDRLVKETNWAALAALLN